jgi:hypothetical protein
VAISLFSTISVVVITKNLAHLVHKFGPISLSLGILTEFWSIFLLTFHILL